MTDLDLKIELAAEVLYEADLQSPQNAIYDDQDKTLNWYALSEQNREKYLKQAKEIVRELIPLYE